MLIGSHVPSADPVAEAAARGAQVAQVFLSAPRAWKAPRERADAAALRAGGLPLYVHAPYLVNLATDDARVRERSRAVVEQTCAAAGAVGARGVVVHGGSVGVDGDTERGLANWRGALERLETDVPILIENTAGGRGAMARHVEALDRLFCALDGLEVGFCLDTCHAHAAGEPLEGLVERLLAVTGGIDLVHANDSKDPAGSGRDRHENLGDGAIGDTALVEVIRAAGAPVVVETPGGAAAHAADVAWLRARLQPRRRAQRS
ncbi:MAG: deoxyribonuclease IV [Actinomycetota bacterium]